MPAIRAKPTRSYPHMPGNAPAPRRDNKGPILIRDDITGVRYDVKPSKKSLRRFDHVGAPDRRTPVSGYQPKVWTLDHLSQEEIDRRLAASASAFDQERLEQSLLHRLLVEREKLEDRLTSPPPPLIDRIEPGPSNYQIPAPPPSDLHFVCTKFLKRAHEFHAIIFAVRDQFDPIFEQLVEYDQKDKAGIMVDIPKSLREGLWKWWDRLEDIGNEIETIPRAFKEQDWRNFGGALKLLKKVDTKLPLVDLCTKLSEMNITLP
jgi:hypothetical protein